MIHLIHNATQHRYNPALFGILGGQPEELTHLQLLQRLLDYVAARGLSHYDLSGSGRAWLDASDIGLRTLLGLQDSAGDYVMWDAGQRLSGWREIVETVHARWVIAEPQQQQGDEQHPVYVPQQVWQA